MQMFVSVTALVALCFLASIGTVAIGIGIWIAFDAWRDIDHTPKPLSRGPHITA
jgi:hypothetical protein